MIKNKCNHDREDLVLHFYGETDEVTSLQISARLEVCSSCREYYESLSAMEAVLPRVPSVEPDSKVMSAVRRATSARIRELSSNRRRNSSAMRSGISVFGFRRAALAAVTAIVIFMVGRVSVYTGPLRANDGSSREFASISDVRLDEDSGLINVRFRTAGTGMISGSVEDAEIRTMLQRALADAGNPSARLRATKILSKLVFDPVTPNPEFVDALQNILSDEPNVGIKLHAVKALQRVHGSRELSESLSALLVELLETSSNSALRIEILELLTQSELARQDLMRILERAATDQNSFIRYSARTALSQLEEDVRLEELN